MANPFPFTAGQVLTAAQMNGIGEAMTAYTPTVANFTTGNGTVTGRFTRINKMIFATVKITLGSTSAITGSITITNPVTGTAGSGSLISGGGFYFDSSTSETYVGFCLQGTTAITPFITFAGATYATRSLINATIPVVFGSGDLINYSFCYEAA
jgi:hypothetical protein